MIRSPRRPAVKAGRSRRASQERPGHSAEDRGDELIADGPDTIGGLMPLRLGEFEGRGEREGQSHILRARASARLLTAAVDERFDGDAGADRGDTDALRRSDLVPGQAERIDAQPGQRQPPGRLHCVRVEEGSGLMGDFGQGRNVGNGADLIVRITQGHEYGVGAHYRGQGLSGHGPIGGQVHLGDGESVDPGEELHRGEHRFVLDGRGDDMSPRRLRGPSPSLGLSAEGHADDREIVRLGAAAGERDIRGAQAEHLCHPSAGIGEGFGWSASEFVMAGRVAERAGQVGPCRFEGFSAHGCRGRGVEVEAPGHLRPRGRGRVRGRSSGRCG